jgi:hypothetical protein
MVNYWVPRICLHRATSQKAQSQTTARRTLAAADFTLDLLFPRPDAVPSEDWGAKDLAKKSKKAGNRLLGGVTPDRDGARRFLGQTLRRAWRRPVADGELEPFTKLFDIALTGGEAFPRAIVKALKSALVSPHFLFRAEGGNDPANPKGATARVNDLELASRLSFFILGKYSRR